MKNVSERHEKNAVFYYSLVSYPVLIILYFFTFNEYDGLNINFGKFFLISLLLFVFGGHIHANLYNKAYKWFGEKINKYVIGGIFSLVIIPFSVCSSIIAYLYFENSGLAILIAMGIFGGAIVRQIALDTIINIWRKEIDNVLISKIKFITKE